MARISLVYGCLIFGTFQPYITQPFMSLPYYYHFLLCGRAKNPKIVKILHPSQDFKYASFFLYSKREKFVVKGQKAIVKSIFISCSDKISQDRFKQRLVKFREIFRHFILLAKKADLHSAWGALINRCGSIMNSKIDPLENTFCDICLIID